MTYPPGPYGPYGPPGPYGPGPPDPEAKNAAVVALIVNVCAMVFCCGVFSIAGVICSAVAMGKADADPPAARKLVRWSWISLIASVALFIVALLVFFLAPFLSWFYMTRELN